MYKNKPVCHIVVSVCVLYIQDNTAGLTVSIGYSADGVGCMTSNATVDGGVPMQNTLTLDCACNGREVTSTVWYTAASGCMSLQSTATGECNCVGSLIGSF